MGDHRKLTHLVIRLVSSEGRSLAIGKDDAPKVEIPSRLILLCHLLGNGMVKLSLSHALHHKKISFCQIPRNDIRFGLLSYGLPTVGLFLAAVIDFRPKWALHPLHIKAASCSQRNAGYAARITQKFSLHQIQRSSETTTMRGGY